MMEADGAGQSRAWTAVHRQVSSLSAMKKKEKKLQRAQQKYGIWAKSSGRISANNKDKKIVEIVLAQCYNCEDNKR